MNIDKSVKKAIDSDWLNEFPQWSSYGVNRYYKIIGPVLAGVELIRLRGGDEYRPHFTIYPLWKKDINDCFNYPIVMYEFHNERNLQFSIKYLRHAVYFEEMVKNVKAQIPGILEGNIQLNAVLNFFDEYARTPPLSAALNSFLQAELKADKLAIALYISQEEARKVFFDITQQDWDLQHFKACGIDINKWLHELQDRINNREAFLRQIITNTNHKKLVKLKRSELIL
ncbi:hypothetical protein [Chitinophaga sp.]|uniref:hypothetical protein n=1 Tax=Chitinophaga sp. TaxID=1869181 RepID=UPI0031E10117